MSATKTLAFANGSAAVTGASGFMTWLGINAPAIGIIFTALMFCVAVIFYTLNYLESKRHNHEMEKDK
jgi:uncharacterized membrane protein YhdT